MGEIMNLTIDKLKKINIQLFILLTTFILNRNYFNYACIIYFIGVMIIYCLKNIYGYKKIKINYVILFIIALFFIGLSICFSNYGFSNLIITFVFLALTFYEFNNSTEIVEDKKFDYFYFILITWLIIFLIYSFLKGYIGTENFCLPSSWDKNYSGVAIFLFLCYCIKKKYKVGIIVSAIYIFFLQSRLIILSTALMLVIWLGIYFLKKFKFINCTIKKVYSLKTRGIFCLILLMTIVISVFSYFVTEYVPISEISQYKESLYDTSNAIRVRANIYAIEKLKSDKSFIISGYDNNIKNVMGVDNEETAIIYEGFRLVQPHNFLLNLLLRYGLILTIIYLLIVSKIIAIFWNKENLVYIIPYLFMNMFMHSILSTTYLMCFIYILSVKDKRKIGDNNI